MILLTLLSADLLGLLLVVTYGCVKAGLIAKVQRGFSTGIFYVSVRMRQIFGKFCVRAKWMMSWKDL